jgi:hypothetical protein
VCDYISRRRESTASRGGRGDRPESRQNSTSPTAHGRGGGAGRWCCGQGDLVRFSRGTFRASRLVGAKCRYKQALRICRGVCCTVSHRWIAPGNWLTWPIDSGARGTYTFLNRRLAGICRATARTVFECGPRHVTISGKPPDWLRGLSIFGRSRSTLGRVRNGSIRLARREFRGRTLDRRTVQFSAFHRHGDQCAGDRRAQCANHGRALCRRTA